MPTKHFKHALNKARSKGKNPKLESLMMIVAVVEPLMTIPQIIDIYTEPGNAHVSLLSWLLYMITSSMWVVYGLHIHSKPLIFTGLLWLSMEVLVVAGLLLH